MAGVFEEEEQGRSDRRPCREPSPTIDSVLVADEAGESGVDRGPEPVTLPELWLCV